MDCSIRNTQPLRYHTLLPLSSRNRAGHQIRIFCTPHTHIQSRKLLSHTIHRQSGSSNIAATTDTHARAASAGTMWRCDRWCQVCSQSLTLCEFDPKYQIHLLSPSVAKVLRCLVGKMRCWSSGVLLVVWCYL